MQAAVIFCCQYLNRITMQFNANQSVNTTRNSGNENPEASLDGSLVLWFCIKLMVVLLGVVGNLLVCNAMWRRLARQDLKRWNVNVFIFSLAVADLGVLLLVFPLSTVVQFVPQQWPFGEVICYVLFPFGDTFYGSSIWSITAIAIDRYWNIGRMNRARSKTTLRMYRSAKRNACIIVVLVWLGSFLVVALPLHIAVEYNSNNRGTTCRTYSRNNAQFMNVYSGVTVVFCYLFPLSIISCAYAKIWKQVQQSSQFHRSMTTAEGSSLTKQRNSKMGHESEQLKQNARVKRILTPVVIAFAITMFPISLFRMFMVFWPGFAATRGNLFALYFHFSEVFVVANSSINPVIYSIVNKKFRHEMNILGCFDRTQQDSLCRRETVSTSVSQWPPAENLRETNL